MIRIYAAVIRHGEFERPADVPSGHLPHPLTADGRRSAAAGAHLLLGHARELDAALHPTIHCSPLLRAWESAEILAETLRRETGAEFALVERAGLAERSLGSAANLTMQEIETAVARDPRRLPLPPGWRRDPHFRLPLPGAESQMQAGARAAAELEAAVAATTAAATRTTIHAFVGHGGCLRHAAVQLGVLSVDEAPRLSMEYSEPVVLERRADGAWSHAAGQWKKRMQATASG